jgi:ATP-dependent Clp protease ATP-binding subunit ClpC
MFNNLTEQSRTVLKRAADEARAMNHSYLGTEHILLGLLVEGSCDVAGGLKRLGLSIDAVRAEIDKIVQRGPAGAAMDDPPLTPRANRAMLLASQSAFTMSLALIGPSQILIGLLREGEGVAALAMRNLGLDAVRVLEEALRIRLSQMRLVERCVRPLCAGMKAKRKMREELLAHLSAIYEEELAERNDPLAAQDAAARRFGDPAEIAGDLQTSLKPADRRDYHIQRMLGWRAPESVVRMMTRSSLLSAAIIAILVGVPFLAGLVVQGWNQTQAVALRMCAALVLLTPAAQFGLGVCYYKTRDALWGVFGSRRSMPNALRWSALAAAVMLASGVGFIAMVVGTLNGLAEAATMLSLACVGASLVCLMLARSHGPAEIRDTIWATLDLEKA